jgi:pimeloyl-ACP methyl ester carboxylesterase
MGASYDINRTIEGGIERIVYRPHRPKSEVPIVMQHGMWHGAWCWESWQVRLAEHGWESHAHSLPGHGQSPAQRPLRWCTLNYYLAFLKAEIDRLPRKPILMGHSMGGALTQWYLKYVDDDLPAVVLVASWNSHEMQSAMLHSIREDPLGSLLCILDFTATPSVRNEQVAAQVLLSPDAVLDPATLVEKLGGESWWVLFQYNPILWQPRRNVNAPMLWMIPGKDGAVLPATQQRSARFYGAQALDVPEGAHNLMMEPNHAELADEIDGWLTETLSG